ncbi:MAG: peptide ABC transporter substrate-binding protein [Sphingomonadales bacterium]
MTLVSVAPSNAEVVFKRGNGAEVESLDIHVAQSVNSSNIQRDLFEGLITESASGELIAGVAESWEVDDTGRVYTFHLRGDARWSNGDPVSAYDFEFGLRRLVDPATASPYAFIVYPIHNAARIAAGDLKNVARLGVKALDDRTLRIRLANPTPYFLGSLTHVATFPVHRKSVQELGSDWVRPGKMISNGAYQLAEWVPQSHITLTKNKHFHDAVNVQIDKVIYVPTEDQAAELKQFRAGELDWTDNVPISQYTWLKRNMPDELHVMPYLGVYYYDINLTDKKFQDIRVRKALALAIDRSVITGKVTRQYQIPAYSLVPPSTNNYKEVVPSWAELSQNERKKLAIQLMAEVGYTPENPLEVEILYNTQDTHRKIAIAVASMWRKIGVKTTMRNEEWKVLLTSRNMSQFEVARDGWIGDYNDPYTFMEIFRSDIGVMNNPRYANTEYDALLDKANQELDLKRRSELMAQAEKILLEEFPIIPIYFYVRPNLIKGYVKGYAETPQWHHYTRWLRIEKTVAEQGAGD